MKVHLIEGEAGCAYARDHQCAAVIVDALRASATTAMLMNAGATEVLAVQELDVARAAKAADPDALLFGERSGLPPEGFDSGNSPLDVEGAANRRVILTTTTGAMRINQAWGAPAIYVGTTTNAAAVAHAAIGHERDIVVIPAGLADDPEFNAQEDWTAAVVVAEAMRLDIGEGARAFARMRYRIQAEGIEVLFKNSPHGKKLKELGLDDDVAFCTREDVTDAVPKAAEQNEFGVRLVNVSE